MTQNRTFTENAPDSRRAELLAQAHTVVFKKPDAPGTMIDTPCLAKLPSGRLLASNNIDGSWGGGIGQAGVLQG